MPPIRILTAVPICDGHDSAINTINLELIRNGIEVVYLGYNRSAKSIVRAAVQEDVVAIGISTYNGGHIEFFEEVIEQLRRLRVQPEIKLFGGGGGTISRADAEFMYRYGVDRIFFAGTTMTEMLTYVKTKYSGVVPALYDDAFAGTDQFISRKLTIAEQGERIPQNRLEKPASAPTRTTKVVGLSGPGGAGKTTLIDELILRFLRTQPENHRIAVLSHDPSVVGSGALLGDRATMIYSQNDRVFMRSLATRGQTGGLSPGTGVCLNAIVQSGVFDFALVETVGTGQEAIPFGIESRQVDKIVLVMPPDYGGRLQLQKIAMIDAADAIVVNKSDLHGSRTAAAEIESRIRTSPDHRQQILIPTQANRHNDPGVDQLFNFLFERPCIAEDAEDSGGHREKN
ncbi:MAG TPA: cobalamin-dependent protein [Chthoniobacterales bacterium]|nr:cobalamin-dependent protein [Chthoniobacterales bacterium]